MLDAAGLHDCKILASNSLDEYLITDLLMQGAKIDVFGVGERLITAKSDPVFGGVYKLVAVENEQGQIIPKIKVSENITKITNSHFKKLYHLFDNESGKALADELCLYNEVINENTAHTIFDPGATWKTKTLTDFTAKELQVSIFKNGTLVYAPPQIEQVREYCAQQVDLLWDVKQLFLIENKWL